MHAVTVAAAVPVLRHPPLRPVAVAFAENRELGINANLIGVYLNIIPKVVRAYLRFLLCVCRG